MAWVILDVTDCMKIKVQSLLHGITKSFANKSRNLCNAKITGIPLATGDSGRVGKEEKQRKEGRKFSHCHTHKHKTK